MEVSAIKDGTSHWVREIFKKHYCRTCCLHLDRVRERSERQTSKFLARMDGEVLLAETYKERISVLTF